MAKKKIKISQIVGLILIIAALYGFSPWMQFLPAAVVAIGPVEIRDIPPYDASRIGISSILLIAGIALISGKIPF